MEAPQKIGLNFDLKSMECFDRKKCVICQKRKRLCLTSTPTGESAIRAAAEIREDVVLSRLQLVGAGNPVYYHVDNECYKSYTMKKTLQYIQSKRERETAETTSNATTDPTLLEQGMRLRCTDTARPPPVPSDHADDLVCVICNSDRTFTDRVRTKHRVATSSRANKFLEAAFFLQDDVFSRIADLDSSERIFAADIYCHDSCIRRYLRKYERHVVDTPASDQHDQKLEIFREAMSVLEQPLKCGYGFTLSEIRELMSEVAGSPEFIVRNNEVKRFLVQQYGDEIRFCQSHRRNEPLMVFSSHLTADKLASKIRSHDAIKEAADAFREAIMETDFGLDDNFCDSSALENSWRKNQVPDIVLTFFSRLFKTSKSRLIQARDQCGGVFEGDDEDGENDEPVDISLKGRYTRIHCMFQTMFYEMHNGQKQTPLHVMMGHSIYDRCRSKELITTTNRVGVSIGYNSVIRRRDLLAAYNLKCAETVLVPLPSHFTKTDFTIAAIDNTDHKDNSSLSGTMSTHDSALVLMQDISDTPSPSKPAVSDTTLNKRFCKIAEKLPCQEVDDNARLPVTQTTIPANFQTAESEGVTSSQRATKETAEVESVIQMLRVSDQDQVEGSPLPTWAGIHALVTTSDPPLKRIGFLPIIPEPITKRSTCVAALRNLKSVLGQLNQKTLPVLSDEGVYHLLVKICLDDPLQYSNIFIMMGMFHFTKIALKCFGRYISGSGIDDALVEEKIFGPNTVKSVLEGTHYVRATQAMLTVCEAIESLMWEAFRKTEEGALLFDEETIEVRDALRSGSTDAGSLFQQILIDSRALRQRFEAFIQQTCCKSELCQYLSNVRQLGRMVKNLITADRDSNWELHVEAVGEILPVMYQYNCTNYIRYASYYHENIKRLELDHPDLYRQFIQGKFTVRDKPGKFNAVSGDMKLEQTIQRSQKSCGGVVGEQRKAAFVAEWQVVFHEVVAISNSFQALINVNVLGHTDTNGKVHHELCGGKAMKFSENVVKLLSCLREKDNPFEVTVGPITLTNLLNKQVVVDSVKKRILNIFKDGGEKYEKLRHERYVAKSKCLMDTIPQLSLPRFDEVPSVKLDDLSAAKQRAKFAAQAQRVMDVSRERGASIQFVLTHDLVPSLLNNDNKKVEKYHLVSELEKFLQPEDRDFLPEKYTVVIDVMATIRQYPWTECSRYCEVLDMLFRHVNVPGLLSTHMVFDSYFQNSLKGMERLRRAKEHGVIDVENIQEQTPILVQMDKFWSSESNKLQLEQLVRDRALVESRIVPIPIITSSFGSDCRQIDSECCFNGKKRVLNDLDTAWMEEADSKLIPHIDWCIRNGQKRVVVISNDADVVALVLFYMDKFSQHGDVQIWLRYGQGAKKRFIPMHVLYKRLPTGMSLLVIKAHVLSGCDLLPKFGTKQAALLPDNISKLQQFASTSNTISDAELVQAESFLVRIWESRLASVPDTFDDLRYHVYRKSAVSLIDLPPTSTSVRGHVIRAFHIIRTLTNLLDKTETDAIADPIHSGWYMDSGVLRPMIEESLLPESLVGLCGCASACETNRCRCRRNGLICSLHCGKCIEKCKNK